MLAVILFASGTESVSFGAIGQWLAVLTFVMAPLYMLYMTWHRTRRQPPIDAEFATKRELRGVAQHADECHEKTEIKIDGLRQEFKTDINRLSRESSERTAGIHTRVDQILEGVSELKGEIKHLRGNQ